jgi:hypothetical protein
MLEYLRGRPSARKLRLFVCACCRQVWHLLDEAVIRHAVDTSERYADGTTTAEELTKAWHTTFEIKGTDGLSDKPLANARFWAKDTATQTANKRDRAEEIVRSVAWAVIWVSDLPSKIALYAEDDRQTVLLRDLFGNPFRPVILSPALLTWHDGTLPQLAQAIYEERDLPGGHLDNDRLAMLADALEDAGCTDQDILSHCRSTGPHVRGWWVVDMLLGKG